MSLTTLIYCEFVLVMLCNVIKSKRTKYICVFLLSTSMMLAIAYTYFIQSPFDTAMLTKEVVQQVIGFGGFFMVSWTYSLSYLVLEKKARQLGINTD
jgi:hypothetical protein